MFHEERRSFEDPRKPPPIPGLKLNISHWSSQTSFGVAPLGILDRLKSSSSEECGGSDATGSEDQRCARRIIVDIGLMLVGLCGAFCVVLGIYMTARAPIRLPPYLNNAIETIGVVDRSWKSTEDQVYLKGHAVLRLTQALVVLFPLLTTFTATLILDYTNLFHSISLRAALLRESRIRTNSNIRLFTASKAVGPNAWFINLVSGLALIFFYGSLSVMMKPVFLRSPIDSQGRVDATGPNGERHGIDLNGWGLLVLGLCLSCQVCVSTWSFYSNPQACDPTALNPIENACAYVQHDHEASLTIGSPSEKESPFLSVAEPTTPIRLVSKPKQRQPPPCELIPSIRRLPLFIWLLFGVFASGVVVAATFAVRASTTNGSYVATRSGRTDVSAYWHYFGQLRISVSPLLRIDLVALLLQTGAQCGITLGLHAVEVLVGIWRDEDIWRAASSPAGSRRSSVFILAHALGWRYWTLVVFKTILHWVVGSALSTSEYLSVSLLPFLAVAVLLLCLALFTECLARAQPRGPQPSTYGDMRAIAEIVDYWGGEAMWWGDKGEADVKGVRRAGTSGYELPGVQMNALYVGIRPYG